MQEDGALKDKREAAGGGSDRGFLAKRKAGAKAQRRKAARYGNRTASPRTWQEWTGP